MKPKRTIIIKDLFNSNRIPSLTKIKDPIEVNLKTSLTKLKDPSLTKLKHNNIVINKNYLINKCGAYLISAFLIYFLEGLPRAICICL